MGCSPSGLVSFVSEAWGISDQKLTMQCGLLDRGDMIMVDKGTDTDTDTSIDISPILVVSDR